MFAIFQHATKFFVFTNAFVKRFVQIAMGGRLEVIVKLWLVSKLSWWQVILMTSHDSIGNVTMTLWLRYIVIESLRNFYVIVIVTHMIWKPAWVSFSTISISWPIGIVKSVRSPISPGFDARDDISLTAGLETGELEKNVRWCQTCCSQSLNMLKLCDHSCSNNCHEHDVACRGDQKFGLQNK